jgi:plasmid stability protein
VASQSIEYWHLGAWLIARAHSVGSNQALEDLSRYLEATDIPCEVALVVSGIEPQDAYDMGRGISFIPWSALRDSAQKQSVHERSLVELPFNLPVGALVREHNTKKIYVPQTDFQQNVEKYTISSVDFTELYDSLICLALVGPSAPQVLAYWVTVPAWTPIIAGSMQIPASEGFSPGWQLSPDSYEQGRQLFEAFCCASTSFQAHMRLVMQHLIRAMRRRAPVDAAIDLGISIESLYLSDMQDDRGELSFRLRIRSARFLGSTEAERKRIYRLMGDVYGLRSRAVHTGSVDAILRKKPVLEVLQEGFSLTAETVRRFIAKGEPDWDKVMFG